MTFDEFHKIVQDGIDGISPKIDYIDMDICYVETVKKQTMKRWKNGWETWQLWIKFLDGDLNAT